MDNTINPASAHIISGQTPGIPAARQDAPRDEAAAAQSDMISVSKGAGQKPKEDVKYIKINVLPQDPEVGPAKSIQFPQDKIGDKIAGERFVMVDNNNPKAIPDLEGNYLFNVGTPQFDQVNAFSVASRTLDMWQGYRGSKVDWAFGGDRLTVNPHKQQGKNAYYSRWEGSTNFFWFDSPVLKKTVQTSEAADIVSHETSHASLDGIRPGYMGWDNETMSVHETAGDFGALLFALQDESNIHQLFYQNDGDFSRESLITRLGEEFGKAIHLEDSNPDNDNQIYLRSMLNNFTYADPDTLPDDHNYDHLTGEPHNFSRLLSASLYDTLVKVYEKNLEKAPVKDDKACYCALADARDTMGKLFVRSFDLAPENSCKYKDVALGMIKVDRNENGGANEAVIKEVFMKRGIITQQDIDNLNTQSVPTITVRRQLSGSEDVQKFLEQYGDTLGIPDGLSMKLRSISTNEKGDRFINLGFGEEMQLSGHEFGKYDGYYADVSGGLTLAFSKNGALLDFNFDAIDDAKKADVKKGVLDCIDKGLVKEAGDDLFKSDTDLYKGEVVTTSGGQKKIVRIPVVTL